MLLSGPSLLQHKNGQLGPDNNFGNFCAHFFFLQKKSAEIPIFIVFSCKQCFKKANLAQIITLEMAKLGPDNNFTAYIYICCGVRDWAKFGHFQSQGLGQVCFLKTGYVTKPYKNRGFSTFFKIKKKARANFQSQGLGQVVLFLDPQLGPIPDFNLAQSLTLEMVFFSLFFAFEKVPKYLFL